MLCPMTASRTPIARLLDLALPAICPGCGEEGPPIVLRHKACGHDMTARVVCSECGEPIQARDVRARLGPGYPPDTPPPGRRVEKA